MSRIRIVALVVSLSVVVIAAIAAILVTRGSARASGDIHIAIVSIAEIDPIAQLRTGFREIIDASEFSQSHRIKYTEHNALGDSTLVPQVADKVVLAKPTVIYVLGTPLAQAIQNRAPELLLVQGAATDPVTAGLARSWEGSGRKYVATSDLPPLGKQIELIQLLTPSVRRLGVLYNPGESNSAAVIQRLRDTIREHRLPFQLIERPIASTADVSQMAQLLASESDAIYLPPDNTVHAAIGLVGSAAQAGKIPLYATVDTAIDAGALATLGVDFTELGRQSARLALRVLAEGEDPASIAIQTLENPSIVVSRNVASRLGVDLEPLSGRPGVTVR